MLIVIKLRYMVSLALLRFLYIRWSDVNTEQGKMPIRGGIETPLSPLHCHTLYLESSRMFICNKECICQPVSQLLTWVKSRDATASKKQD